MGLQLTSEIAPQIQVFGPNEKPTRRRFAAMFWWVLGGVRESDTWPPVHFREVDTGCHGRADDGFPAAFIRKTGFIL